MLSSERIFHFRGKIQNLKFFHLNNFRNFFSIWNAHCTNYIRRKQFWIIWRHPLRVVGIMMRPQQAERATIICSAGSWDPTIVPTPDSTEGNYFRITTRSAAAARSSSTLLMQTAAAAVSGATAAAAGGDPVVATVSSHHPVIKLHRSMKQSLEETIENSTEQWRKVESRK